MCAWSAPLDWSVNQVVSHTDLNTYVSDNLTYLYNNRFDSTAFGVAPLSALSTSDLTCTGSFVAVPGGTVTLLGTATYLVTASAVAQMTATIATHTVTTELQVAGATQQGSALAVAPQNVLATCSQAWLVTTGTASVNAVLRSKCANNYNDVIVGGQASLVAWQIKAGTA